MSRAADAVITGIGAVCSLGHGFARLRAALFEGRPAIGPVTLFDTRRHRTRVAGEVPGRFPLERRSRTDRFGIAAGREAIEQAGLRLDESGLRSGVFLGTSTGGMLEGERAYRDILEGRVPVTRLVSQQTSSPSEALARELGCRGPVETIASACAAATMAIGSALSALRHGEVDVAVCGGADGLCELTFAGFNSLRAVSPEACRPFRLERCGLSLGEGSACLVLERRESAEARGAKVLGTLLGAGASCDAHHMTAPDPRGHGPARAMKAALLDAGCEPEAIDFVNAHGTATPHNDSAEAAALREVFGERLSRLPVTSTKAFVGHLLGASGALEAAATLACLMAHAVHPTPGEGRLDPELRLDVVQGEARPLPNARLALSTNLAFGGANAALVIGVA